MKLGEIFAVQGAAFIIYAALGALCFDYSLFAIIGKDIPWLADLVVGFFFGWATIPAAIVC